MDVIHRSSVWCCFALLLLAAPPFAGAAGEAATGVGFAPISIHDPVTGRPMPGYVFYPSVTARGTTTIGPYMLHATEGAPPVAGPKALVVISHGHGGSDLGHHDLAVYLASHGFVVATLQHPLDNFRDDSGDGHPEVMIGRPIQVKATISRLLHDTRWKKLIDPRRIGVAGFSNGGYTSLLLVGAVPRFIRFISYCRKNPADTGLCDRVKEVTTRLVAQGTNAREYLTSMQRQFDHWGDPDDPRIKAAFVMAPLSLVFDRTGLALINRPVFLYYAQADRVLIPKYNVLHIAPLIKSLAGIKMIPEAGRYVFLSPCSTQLAKDAPAICVDPAGVDRAAAHTHINATALAFFRRTLAAPSD